MENQNYNAPLGNPNFDPASTSDPNQIPGPAQMSDPSQNSAQMAYGQIPYLSQPGGPAGGGAAGGGPAGGQPGSGPGPVRKKKKKRRLRKEIRIALPILGVLLVGLLIWGITSLMSGSRGSDTEAKDQKQTETTASQNTQKQGMLTIYPDEHETVATVMLDAGHGGFDGGNVAIDPVTGEQILEKDITLKLTKMVEEKLKQSNPNLKVLMTRTSDETSADNEFDDLRWRVDQQQQYDVDYFISLHGNSFPDDESVTGYDFFVKSDDAPTIDMAKAIQSNLEKAGWSDFRGINHVDKSPLYVVSVSDRHAMLMEIGYMSNTEELAGMQDDATLEKIAEAIAAGISDYIMENPDAKNQKSEPTDADIKDAKADSSDLESGKDSLNHADPSSTQNQDPASPSAAGTGTDVNPGVNEANGTQISLQDLANEMNQTADVQDPTQDPALQSDSQTPAASDETEQGVTPGQ